MQPQPFMIHTFWKTDVKCPLTCFSWCYRFTRLDECKLRQFGTFVRSMRFAKFHDVSFPMFESVVPCPFSCSGIIVAARVIIRLHMIVLRKCVLLLLLLCLLLLLLSPFVGSKDYLIHSYSRQKMMRKAGQKRKLSSGLDFTTGFLLKVGTHWSAAEGQRS